MSVRIVFLCVVFCGFQLITGAAAKAGTHYVPEIPASCRNSTYCEDVPNYPQDEVNKLIAKLGKTLQFQLDKLDYLNKPHIKESLGVGPIEDNIELCKFEEKIVYPKTARGVDGKWYALVNNDDEPVQGYKVEVCETSDGCDGIATFQEGYEARCKQKYMIRKATAFEKSSDQIETFEKEIQIPSCCSCVAKVTTRV